jgi:toxin ParE1/3/4
MSGRIIILPRAASDLKGIAVYYFGESFSAALRFSEAVQATFDQLAGTPLMGSPRPLLHPRLADLRQWRVRGFENYLIFYRPIEDGIEIVRVLHGARDLERLFGDTTEDETT